MGDESLHLPNDNIEYCIVTLFEKLEALRNDTACTSPNKLWKVPAGTELRSLEFWRSVICECLASFCYIFIVCGADGTGASSSSLLFATALASSLSITTLTQCFGQISGAQINPAVTIAMAITKNISLIRTVMFIIAQCGGGIAGAAFLYGMAVSGSQSNLSAPVMHTTNIMAWERFGVEFILSFIIVLTYLVTMDNYSKWLGSSSLTIGAAYGACTFVSMPCLNPARSLGPSFVLSRWDYHWVYWIGPLTGGVVSGLVYEYILNPRRRKSAKDSTDADSISIQSDEDPYDDLEKPSGSKYNGSSYNYRQTSNVVVTSTSGYCPSLMSASLYSSPLCKLERVESLYGGTKSLYCKSPPLTRANLNRSQSVYTKSNNGVNRDVLPRPGPLVPTQSLYPMRLNQQQSHLQNQNVQNQMQQRSESTFGMRGVTSASHSEAYVTVGIAAHSPRNNSSDTDNTKFEETQKVTRSNRPESMYSANHPRHAQSDDSNYSTYYGSSKRSNTNSNVTYNNTSSSLTAKPTGVNSTSYGTRSSEVKHSPSQLLTAVSTSSSFHHMIPQHSTAAQY
ncbi:hypothetical protein ILUMI_23149 [Ignelater luminosus]|uniref:Big brain n=1 Tax=Ignelater luminosus TaxID=2038154 RepID=A0A8K0CCI9_IGNLU|nr:hypothetical protein ILUMI_23149 [Ignelater luminosus]